MLVLLGIAGIALYLVILASAPIATSCHGYITAHRPDGVWNYYCEDRGP